MPTDELCDWSPGGVVIRILLAHRGALLRGALAALLANESDLKVVADVGCTDDVLPEATQLRPQLVVLDCALPGTTPIHELCNTLGRVQPDCGVLCLLDRRAYGRLGHSLLRLAPRVGLVGTESPPKDFVDGIRRLVRGEPVLDPDLAVAALRSGDATLTARECDVLRLAAQGATSKEIARNLCLSTGTVRNYLSRILSKLGARTRVEAIRIAQDAGWI